MERESAKRLITARWIVTMMYVGPLVVFQFVGRAVRPSPAPSTASISWSDGRDMGEPCETRHTRSCFITSI